MKASTDRQRAEELAHFCYTMLGLKYPNEPTYATWTSLLASFDPECSSFDLRSKYETVAECKDKIGADACDTCTDAD